MATVQSLGLGSGLDISGIITAIVDAERVPTTNQLDRQQSKLDAQISAFGTLKSKVSAIDSAVSTLAASSTYNRYSAKSSDESVFTATTSALAESGSYSIEVSSQAQGHTLASKAYASVNDTVGSGTLTIRFGSSVYDSGADIWTPPFEANSSLEEVSITIDDSNNTLSSLRDYINAGDYGIDASIVNDGSGYRLLLTSETGATNSMEITVADNDGGNLDANGLSSFAFNENATNATQTVAASNANLTINGLAVTSTSNTLTEAIPGVTLNITGTDPGSTKTLSVTQDKENVKERIETLVTAYNDFNTTLREVTAYVAPGSEENGVLLGDVTARSIQNQVRSTLLSRVSGLTGSVTALADLGILSNQNTGELEIDEAKLSGAINSNFDDIKSFFTPNGDPSDALISYVSSTNDTVAGTYAIEITQMATQGTYQGDSVLPDFDLGGSVTITDGVDDQLIVCLNGISSETVTLKAGTYTDGASLAAEIQDKINSAPKLVEAGLTASVSYDAANNRLIMKSTNYGSSSTIAVTATTTSGMGLTVATGTDGVDAAGTIDGAEASGNGQFLTSTTGNAKDLRISTIGGTIGPRGDIVFTRGIADKLDGLLERLTDTSGAIDAKTSGLDASLERIKQSREQLTLRMDKLESRLLAQFTAMDTLVSQLNGISGFLTSTLAALPGAAKPGGDS